MVNQVIRKGWLTLRNVSVLKGGSKEYWFVLTSEAFIWFKEEEEKEKKYMLPLDNLKLRDVGTHGVFSAKPTFALFNVEGRNVYQNHKEIELSAESQEEADAWKASFLRAGVFPEKNTKETHDVGKEELGSVDPQLERQIETIRNLVDSYLQIIHKSHKDMVPKTIMHMIVSDLKVFTEGGELHGMLYAAGNPMELMEESPETAQKREETLRMYHAMKDALGIISEVASSAMSTSLSSNSLNNTDWMASNGYNSYSSSNTYSSSSNTYGGGSSSYGSSAFGSGAPSSYGTGRVSPAMSRPQQAGAPPPVPTGTKPTLPNRPAPAIPSRPAPSLPPRPGAGGSGAPASRPVAAPPGWGNAPLIPDRPSIPGRPNLPPKPQ